MGNTLFSNVDALLGYKTTTDWLNVFSMYKFDPTSVQGVDFSCMQSFQEEDVSSVPVRLGAIFANAQFDEDMKANDNGFLDKDFCDDNGYDTITCDFEKLYKYIIAECVIVNLRGAGSGFLNQYYGGSCEELLGITEAMSSDMVLSPQDEWCQAYYGKSGTPTFSTIIVEMQADLGSYDDMYSLSPFVELANSTIGFGSNTQKLIIENVPYCTAFESCSVQDFFTMIQADADSYAASYLSQATDMDSYSIQVIPEEGSYEDSASGGECVDSSLKMVVGQKMKSCSWAGKKADKRCMKKSVQKHCPDACSTCEEFACVDSPRKFKVGGIIRNCDWAAENPQTNCANGVDSVCRETCGMCE